MAARERLERCRWCDRRDVLASEWEQEHLSGGYSTLCTRCAGKRLRNPWNALLPMRKRAVPGEQDSATVTVPDGAE